MYVIYHCIVYNTVSSEWATQMLRKKQMEKRKCFFCFFSALMSVSYLVHTPCIPIMMDINILFSKSPAQLVQKKPKWKMKISVLNELSCNLPIFQSKVDIKIEYKMLSMLKDRFK